MNPPRYAALALAVILLTLGQLLQKVAVDGIAGGGSTWKLVTTVLCRPTMWAALACLGGGLIAWLLVLDSMDVSKAFPYLSVGQVLVLLAAKYHFHEDIPASRWAGALLIFAGIGLISQS